MGKGWGTGGGGEGWAGLGLGVRVRLRVRVRVTACSSRTSLESASGWLEASSGKRKVPLHGRYGQAVLATRVHVCRTWLGLG